MEPMGNCNFYPVEGWVAAVWSARHRAALNRLVLARLERLLSSRAFFSLGRRK